MLNYVIRTSVETKPDRGDRFCTGVQSAKGQNQTNSTFAIASDTGLVMYNYGYIQVNSKSQSLTSAAKRNTQLFSARIQTESLLSIYLTHCLLTGRVFSSHLSTANPESPLEKSVYIHTYIINQTSQPPLHMSDMVLPKCRIVIH